MNLMFNVVILLFIMLDNIIRPEIIGAFFTGILGPIIVTYVKTYIELKQNNKRDPISESIKFNIQIDNKIHQILDEYKADRIWVTQFHNGGNFYPTGRSIHKFSIFYEIVNIGVKSIKDNFQNIPVSLFTKSINYLLENDVIEITDFRNEIIATHGLKYLAEEHGTKSSYMFAIKSIDDKFLGVLGIDYMNKKILTPQQISDLRVEVTTIGGVLINSFQKII